MPLPETRREDDTPRVSPTRPRIVVVGDYQPDNETHAATNAALGHVGVDFDWVGTEVVEPEQAVADYDALWIAPASPYRNMEAALEAIRLARERGVPLVGT
jgi:CTP synthase (UTP-ammonia lyase)